MADRDNSPSEIPYEERALPNLEDVYPRFLGDHDEPQLLECFVLSLDLPGTKAETGEEAAKQLQLTEQALGHARRESGTEPKARGSVVRWFSDNVAIADIHDGAFDSLTFGFHLMTAAALQAELAVQGRFSRGGIALGEFFARCLREDRKRRIEREVDKWTGPQVRRRRVVQATFVAIQAL